MCTQSLPERRADIGPKATSALAPRCQDVVPVVRGPTRQLNSHDSAIATQSADAGLARLFNPHVRHSCVRALPRRVMARAAAPGYTGCAEMSRMQDWVPRAVLMS
jgi:hypothetical protein